MKNASNNKKFYFIEKKTKNIEKTKIYFQKENYLKKKWLTSFLEKFSIGQNAFDMLLVIKKYIFDKKGVRIQVFHESKVF